MPKSLHLIAGAALLVLAPAVVAIAAEKDDPAKFKYPNIPVEATCLEGYHPTVDPTWGNVFPCIKDAEIVAPPTRGVAVKAATVQAN